MHLRIFTTHQTVRLLSEFSYVKNTLSYYTYTTMINIAHEFPSGSLFVFIAFKQWCNNVKLCQSGSHMSKQEKQHPYNAINPPVIHSLSISGEILSVT